MTGGAGFIGSHLCERLLVEGWDVVALDDLSTGRIANVAHLDGHPRFRLVRGSVLSPCLVEELVADSDAVYHLAGSVGVRLVLARPSGCWITNTRGTAHVLDSSSRRGKRVLLVSSSEVYGNPPHERELAETDGRSEPAAGGGRWVYAESKLYGESLALAWHRSRRLDCVIVRLFNISGSRQRGMYGMVLPAFVDRALSSRALEVYGDGTQVRCFCHVHDAVEALIRLMGARAVTGEVFNVGSQEAIQIRDLAARVVARTGSASGITLVAYRDAYGAGFEDVRHRSPSLARIAAVIGWKPSRSLDETVDDVIRDFQPRVAGGGGVRLCRIG